MNDVQVDTAIGLGMRRRRSKSKVGYSARQYKALEESSLNRAYRKENAR
jgi:hypothetical protein